jgi:chromatin remodeling complex protein RSC6
MSKEAQKLIDEVIETMNAKLEEARKVVELHKKLDKMLKDQKFSLKMSVLSMALSKTILDESDDFNEAYSYVARISHTLVDVLDRHHEQAEAEEENGGSPLQ